MFTKVFERLKCPSKFVDVNDVSTIGEYWGTFLLLTLPLGLLGGIFISIPFFFFDPGYEVSTKILEIIGVSLLMVAALAFYPVFTRRIRDIGVPPWIALAYIVPMIFPYVYGLTCIMAIAFGCIPGRANAAEKCEKAPCCSAMLWIVSMVLFTVAGVRMMQGTQATVLEQQFENAIKDMEKNMRRSFSSGMGDMDNPYSSRREKRIDKSGSEAFKW